jgi:branched-chain amino acid transport system ATP-binding protein
MPGLVPGIHLSAGVGVCSSVDPGAKPRDDPEGTMAHPVLETRGLTIRFGGHVAVDGVSAAFHAGTLTAIVGPNGAGKTTYFNLISGQLPATAGNVLLDGVDITASGAATRARRGIGRSFQLTNLFPNLSVHENVRLAVQARAGGGADILSRWSSRIDWIERADQFIEAANLADKRDIVAVALPHGDKRKLEVAIMMALEPHVFMFDEPTAGMSVDDVPVILDLIKALKGAGDKTILLVEHKMDVVRSLADRIVVLHNGRLVADGEPGEVISSPVVQEAYLGVAAKPVAAGAANG